MPVVARCRADEGLDVAWRALMSEPSERRLAHRYGVTRDAFIAKHRVGTTIGIWCAGVLAGCAWFHDRAIHLAVLSEYRSRWFSALPEVLRQGFALHGSPLYAVVNADNERALRFMEQVGCVPAAVQTDMVRLFEVWPDRMRYRKGSYGRHR